MSIQVQPAMSIQVQPAMSIQVQPAMSIQAFVGEMSQFNMWDRVLRSADIIGMANCSAYMPGNVIPWVDANVEHDWELIFMKARPTVVFFSYGRLHAHAKTKPTE
ncbi:hypothetical protein CRUP_027813 [Coryphaenoides rupestris]|nr:hypothetical protein CRUP_027813 [Coryphaenoides rupestris]